MNTKKKMHGATSQEEVVALVARAELRDVEVIRQSKERKFGGGGGGPSPMPEDIEVRPTFDVFTPNGEIREHCAFLVSLKIVWAAAGKPKEEFAHAWVALRLVYAFAGQEEAISASTLRTFGEGVVRNQAWPFLRERVFTLSQLAGLPHVVLPLIPLSGALPRVAPTK